MDLDCVEMERRCDEGEQRRYKARGPTAQCTVPSPLERCD